MARTISGITADAKGNVWYLVYTTTVPEFGIPSTSALQVGKLTSSGHVTETPLPTTSFSGSALASAGGITVGSDGNLYTTINNEIGQLILARGAVDLNAIPNPNGGSLTPQSQDITTGPDGNIWYTQQSPAAIVELSTADAPSAPPTTTTTQPLVVTPTATPTPTPTAAPATTPAPTPTFAPPEVVFTTTTRKKGRIQTIQLTFASYDPSTNQPRDLLNVANASNLANYLLTTTIRGRKSHKNVAIAFATYNHTQPDEVVSLTLPSRSPRPSGCSLPSIRPRRRSLAFTASPSTGMGMASRAATTPSVCNERRRQPLKGSFSFGFPTGPAPGWATS